jgi:cob(I)alamin adenosyltransferase
MLYTGRGDNGTTKIFGCDQRVSKSSEITEALGALDELNSFLGFCKVCAAETARELKINKHTINEVVNNFQQDLFIIQAELAGANKKIRKAKITRLENIINAIEKELKQIKTFFIPGGSELSALFDTARAIARRVERRVVEVSEKNKTAAGKNTLAYLNRLSSALYALARLANHKFGKLEQAPDYR